MFSACVFCSRLCHLSNFLAVKTAEHPDFYQNRLEITLHSPTNLTSRALGSLLQSEAGGKNFPQMFFISHPSAQETRHPVKYCISPKPQDRILINIQFSVRTLCKKAVSAWFWPCLWHWRNIFETNKIFIRVLCFVIASLSSTLSHNRQVTHQATSRKVLP